MVMRGMPAAANAEAKHEAEPDQAACHRADDNRPGGLPGRNNMLLPGRAGRLGCGLLWGHFWHGGTCGVAGGPVPSLAVCGRELADEAGRQKGSRPGATRLAKPGKLRGQP